MSAIYQFTITVDGTDYDISSDIVRSSLSFDEKLYSSLKANTNCIDLELSRGAYFKQLFETYDDIQCVIRKDGDPFFVGYISNNSSVEVNNGGLQNIQVEIEDIGIKKLQVPVISANGVETYFSNATATKIITDLLNLAGVKYNTFSIDKTITTLTITDSDEKTYWDIIDGMLYEFGYTFVFDASGKFTVTKLYSSAISTVKNFIAGSNILGTITTEKKRLDYNKVVVKWESYKTVFGATVSSDTSGATGSYKCKIAVAPGGYYPESADVDNPTDVSYSVSGCTLVIANNATLSAKYDGDIIVEVATDYHTKMSLRLHNTSGVTRYIYQLDIVADIVIVDTTYKTTSELTGSKIYNYESSYIHNVEDAKLLANYLEQYFLYTKNTVSLSSETDYRVGDYVHLTDELFTGMIGTFRITEKVSYAQKESFLYSLEGVTALIINNITTKKTTTPYNPVTTTYTWIMYADDSTGKNMSADSTGKKYIGVAINKTTPEAGSDPSEYTWTMIQGVDGVSYYISCGTVAISMARSGVLTPTSISITAKVNTDSYLGRFIIAEMNDSTYTDKYTSSKDEATRTYTPTPGIEAVRIRLYESGGITSLLDEIIIYTVLDSSSAPLYWGATIIEPTLNMEKNDYYFFNDTPDNSGGTIRYYSGSIWKVATSSWIYYVTAWMMAMADAMTWCTKYSTTLATVSSFITALINNLIAQNGIIKNLSTATQSSTALCDDGITPIMSINWNTALQSLSSADQKNLMNICQAYIQTYVGSSSARRGFKLTGDYMTWFNSPVSGIETVIARIGRICPADNDLLMVGDIRAPIQTSWSISTLVTGALATPVQFQRINGDIWLFYLDMTTVTAPVGHECIKASGSSSFSSSVTRSAYTGTIFGRCAYYETQAGVLHRLQGFALSSTWKIIDFVWSDSTLTWSYNALISTNGRDPCAIVLTDGTIRIAYTRYAQSSSIGIYEVIFNPATGNFSEEVLISETGSTPCYILRSNGELRIGWQNSAFNLVERILNNESRSWGNPITSGISVAILTYIETISDELHIYSSGVSNGMNGFLYSDTTKKWTQTETLETTVQGGQPSCIQRGNGDISVVCRGYASGYSGAIVELTKQQFAKIGAGVIESGSNSSGYYIKLSNGYVFQYYRIPQTDAAGVNGWSAWGSEGGWYSSTKNWFFPVPFAADLEFFSCMSGDISASQAELFRTYNATRTYCTMIVQCNATSSGNWNGCSVFAFGRYK